MTMTDPLADMLTRIRNGILVRRQTIDIPSSKMKSSVALILKDEGYLADVETIQDDRGFSALRLTLKYDEDGRNAIADLKRISKPGCRIYSAANDLPEIRNGLGITLISTSSGVLSGRKAAELGVGGEVLCSIF